MIVAARFSASWDTHTVPAAGYLVSMLVLVIVLLAVWLVLSIIGFAIQGLLWLGLVGVVLFLATAIVGWLRRAANRS